MKNLYILPTPIGNKGDITIRSIEILKNIDTIFCEDTRVTKKLLQLLEIDYNKKTFIAYHDHNETNMVTKSIQILLAKDAILVSDAGTPLINDPGFKLIREIRTNFSDQIKIESLPGPTSIITALTQSGFPTDKFSFLGYFPVKKSKRKKLLQQTKEIDKILPQTFITLETPHRIESTIELIEEIYTDKISLCICRELTKKFESIHTGNATQILNNMKNGEIKTKGEFVLLFRFDQS